MLVYVCTSNHGKLEEFVLAGRESGLDGLQLEPLPHLRNISAPDETGSTFEENARLKASYYSQFTEERVLADDSGLAVEALNGAPGVHSARYAGPNATSADNNALLISQLQGVENRAAQFVCVLAVAWKGRVIATASGSVSGVIGEPAGVGGFGYDPLFFYTPLSRTFGELSETEKLALSHRGNALRELFKSGLLSV